MGQREDFAALELLSFYPCKKFADRKEVFSRIVESDFEISGLESEIEEIRKEPSKTPLRTLFTPWTPKGYTQLLEENIRRLRPSVQYSLMWAVELGMHKTNVPYIKRYLEGRCEKYGIPLNSKKDDWGDGVLRKEVRRRINEPEQLDFENISTA